MNANKKWLQIFLDILAYEFDHVGDGELLSEAADRLIARRPIAGRIFILAAGAVITLHLANIVGDRYDVMSKRFWEKIRGSEKT